MTKTKKTKMGQSILKGLKQALAYEQGTLTENESNKYRVHDFSAIDVERLRQDIFDGINSGPGTTWNPAEIKREARKMKASKTRPDSK